jgi:hypothetical protein
MGSGTLHRGGFSCFTSSGGGGGTSSLPHFLDGSLDAMHLLEEGEALGFTSWWPETVVLGFSWCCSWRSSWPTRIYIDKTADCQAVGHAPRNLCSLRRALASWPQKSCDHKETCDCSYFIQNTKCPTTPMSCSILRKNYELFVFLSIYIYITYIIGIH